MIADVAWAAAEVGLELHPDKTKILHNGIGYGAGVTQTSCNGMNIEVLDFQKHAMYLGRALCLRDMHDEELRNRTAKAWAKFSMYKQELTDKKIPIWHRMKLFETLITPTILYGSGCWVMTLGRRQALRTTQRQMMRMILGTCRKPGGNNGTDELETYVEWVQRATKEAERLMEKYNVREWTWQQRDRLWRWASKVAHSKDGRWSHEVLHWDPIGQRPKGRPRARWTDQLTSFLKRKLGRDIGAYDWIELAKNSKIWKDLREEFCNFQSAEPSVA